MAVQEPTQSCNPEASGKVVDVALAGLFRRGARGIELLVAKRRQEAIRGGLWEYPGGKIEAGEAPEAAALREMQEEVGLTVEALCGPLHALSVVEHCDPALVRERTVRLHPFVVEVKPSVTPRALSASELRWVPLDELDCYEWPGANAAVHAALAGYFAEYFATPVASPVASPVATSAMARSPSCPVVGGGSSLDCARNETPLNDIPFNERFHLESTQDPDAAPGDSPAGIRADTSVGIPAAIPGHVPGHALDHARHQGPRHDVKGSLALGQAAGDPAIGRTCKPPSAHHSREAAP